MSEPMHIYRHYDDPNGVPNPTEIVPEDDRWCPLPGIVFIAIAALDGEG